MILMLIMTYYSWWYPRHAKVFSENKWYNIKCVGLLKKIYTAMTLSDCNVLNVNPLKCVSKNNNEYKIKTKIITIKQ